MVFFVANMENANPPKRQKTINSFFGGMPPSAPVSTEKEESTKKSEQTLLVTTTDNRKKTSLVKYNGEEWLEVNKDPDNKPNVSTLSCKICKQIKDRINLIKNFNKV